MIELKDKEARQDISNLRTQVLSLEISNKYSPTTYEVLNRLRALMEYLGVEIREHYQPETQFIVEKKKKRSACF